MFTNLTRVEQKHGCHFYTQDIILLDYVYSGDVIITMDVQYKTPGFGIVLIENNNDNIFDTAYSALYRIGDSSYAAGEVRMGKQYALASGVFPTVPSDDTVIHLTWYRKDTTVWMTYTYTDEEGKTVVYGSPTLTNAELSEDLQEYRIGFYSNAGNTIQYADIQTIIPDNWIVNINNTNGGRVFFETNGFRIEECEYNAEVEQQNIELSSGTYYLKYILSDDNDIDVFINPATEDNSILFDETKSILNADGHTFTIPMKETKPGKWESQKMKINVKFRGTHGRVGNIQITERKDASYFPTTEDGITFRDGSMIRVHLDKIQELDMEGTITSIPNHKLNESTSYFIARFDESEPDYQIEDFHMKTGTEYSFIYKNGVLEINGVKKDATGHSILDLLYNVDAIITKCIVTMKDGKKSDIIAQDTYKVYVSDKLQTPIIVVDKDTEEPFDLSTSFREVIKQTPCIDIFYQTAVLSLSHRMNMMHQTLKVYGIPSHAKIDKNAKDIDTFASDYTELSPTQYSYDFNKNEVIIDESLLDTYKNVAAAYQSADTFTYHFTNWEREIFPKPKSSFITLFNPITKRQTGKLMIYGIPKGEQINQKYLFRVPSTSMIHSLDLFCQHRDLLQEDAYTLYPDKNRIYILPEVLSKYDYLVIDYLKENSYTVNDLPDIGEYEVDISSNDTQSVVLYDSGENGEIGTYAITDIRPTQDRYIVLSRKDDDA